MDAHPTKENLEPVKRVIKNAIALIEEGSYKGGAAPAVAEVLSFLANLLSGTAKQLEELNVPAEQNTAAVEQPNAE